jgi:histone H3/H4
VAKAGGVALTDEVYDELRGNAKVFLEGLFRGAATSTEYRRARTVSEHDVAVALGSVVIVGMGLGRDRSGERESANTHRWAPTDEDASFVADLGVWDRAQPAEEEEAEAAEDEAPVTALGRAECAVKNAQAHGGRVFPFLPVAKLVMEIAQDCMTSLDFAAGAIAAMDTALERYLVRLVEGADRACLTGRGAVRCCLLPAPAGPDHKGIFIHSV